MNDYELYVEKYAKAREKTKEEAKHDLIVQLVKDHYTKEKSGVITETRNVGCGCD